MGVGRMRCRGLGGIGDAELGLRRRTVAWQDFVHVVEWSRDVETQFADPRRIGRRHPGNDILAACLRVPQCRRLVEPAATDGSRYDPSPIAFERRELGPRPERHPMIANVQILDFDGDGRNDVIACDVRRQAVVLGRRNSEGEWREQIIAEDMASPAHATVVDLDRDGDLDLVVSILGDILPNDGVVGRLIWLEQTAAGLRPAYLARRRPPCG